MKKFDDTLWLFTEEEFAQLPDGIRLESINGKFYIKGIDDFCFDKRFNHLAYGIRNPNNHSESELFLKFMLE